MIFVGITLSMQFDNWNEARKLKQREMELLSAIYLDLSADFEDLNGVIQNFDEFYIEPIKYLDSCLRCTKPVDFNHLGKPIVFPIGGTFMDQNKGAYECFKYDGATLVKDNRLKIKLFDYYEAKLSWVDQHQSWQEEYRDEYVYPLYMKYTNNESSHISCENYLKMRNDKHVHVILYQWKTSYIKNQKVHRELLPILLDLKSDVEKELVANGIDPKQILKEAKSTIS